MPSSPPSRASASSASTRSTERADTGARRALVDPGAAVVAIDADGREIADPVELRHGGRGSSAARAREHRIAILARRDRLHEHGWRSAESASSARLIAVAVEDEGRDAGARRASAFSGERVVPETRRRRLMPREGLGRIAGAEDRSRQSSIMHRRSRRQRHSARTSASASSQPVCRESAANSPAGISRDSAQTASAAHQRRRVAGKRSGSGRPAPRSPELPMAISTLRTKRSRPMRLTGEPAKQRAEAGVVERERVRRAAAPRDPSRGGELRFARGLRELVPGADGEAVVAAIDAVADRARGTRAGSAPCARW